MAGERSGLFYEIIRLCSEIKPRWIFLENVPAITTRGGLEVVREIAKMGYDCRWVTITASSVGALHKRERWFLLAHSIGTRLEGQGNETISPEQKKSMSSSSSDDDLSNTLRERFTISGTEEFEKKSTEYLHKIDGNTNSQPSQQTNQGAESEQTERRTWGRSTGQYWPFESREHWQKTVSEMGKCTDGLQNELAHVDLERCFVLLYTYGETNNKNIREVLSSVWNFIEAYPFQKWKTTTITTTSKEEILQQFLQLFLQEFEYNRNFEEFISQKSAKTPKEFVRSVRNKNKTSSTSYRSRLQKQLSREHSNSLSNLSLLLAQNIESAWIEKCRQDAKDLIDQLRSLGNSVVSQQVKEAFKILMGLKQE